jgi:pilus assembly protein CpaB
MREIAWPDGALPAGAFATIGDVLKDGKRIVLAAIEPNEPVLTVKITGPVSARRFRRWCSRA